MSGGSFDYAYGRVDQFADELGLRLDEFDKKDEWGYQPNNFEPETLAKLREIEALARHTAKLMKEAEWLYSGDTGDDSFMERVAKIESERIAFRLAPKFAALIEENKRLRGILACAEIELVSYLDQYTGTFGDECLRKLMTPNASFRGGPEARPAGNDS